MYFYQKATQVAAKVLRAFERPRSLPEPLATVYINRQDSAPCRKWSVQNQAIVALHGHSDARSYDQWKAAGRYVKQGEKAFYIRPPVDDGSGIGTCLSYGRRGTPVFGLNQTDGELLPPGDSAVDRWLHNLPLRVVADVWGVSVQAYNGSMFEAKGWYSQDRNSIALGVKNLFTWAHELLHAADHRNEYCREIGQHWRSETVAYLGGSILLKILGYEQEADLGRCRRHIQHYARGRKIGLLPACQLVLERTCEAVALILETERTFREEVRKEELEYDVICRVYMD